MCSRQGPWSTFRGLARWLAPVALTGLLLVVVLATDSGDWLYRVPACGTVGGCTARRGWPTPGLDRRRPFPGRPWVWVGRISHGLYLWHWPVCVVLGRTYRRVGARAVGSSSRGGVTFGVATLSYYAIEMPHPQGSARNWTAQQRLAVVVAAPVAVLASWV